MDLSSLTPLEGSSSGQTFLGVVAGDRCVVRIYADPGDRGDAAAEIDAALLRLVRGLVPVPEVLEARRPDPAVGAPGLLVTSFVPGVTADKLLPDLDGEGRARVGRSLGTIAAVIAGMPLLRPGPFVDGDLTVGKWADRADREHPERTALVHGSLDPGHVLLDTETLEVRAVTGWGSAHAGDPLADLAHLLTRAPAGEFREAALGAFAGRHGGTAQDLGATLALP
ncbi:hypothetical protein GCM10009623_02570 [Nocardioides aestuarii]|uniref:Phosphotransferase family protein n=1 Tax=Nocardioides aestuarii TaxID=252231 RepID=A0ABW4TJI3_9ACTN